MTTVIQEMHFGFKAAFFFLLKKKGRIKYRENILLELGHQLLFVPS